LNELCRPETVESLFIAFRLTGDNRYRDHGWAIFQAIEKHCKIPGGGYATIINVDEVPVRHEDKMETFFLVSLFSFCSLKIDWAGVLSAERDAEILVLTFLGRRHDPTIE
jgi:hypothetical protein